MYLHGLKRGIKYGLTKQLTSHISCYPAPTAVQTLTSTLQKIHKDSTKKNQGFRKTAKSLFR